jgi:hypothetical protein
VIPVDDFRLAFERVGFPWVDLDDGSPGGRTLCSVCRHVLTVRPEGMACEKGCDPSRIADELHYLTESPGGFARAQGARFEETSSWSPVDLAAILNGKQHDQAPEILARVDGVCLLYRGRIHAGSAEPESCKGWWALHGSKERLAAGEHVVYVDYEDTAANIVARLLALDVEPDAIRERFHYLRPDDPVTGGVVDALSELAPALVVIDGVTEALAMEALDLASNQDVAEFFKRLARPFARAGAAVLLIDHVVKDKEARGRYAIGAQHKLAGVDVAYRLDVVRPFGRGREGLVKVTVTKDRPGFVRQHAAGSERVAMMRLTSSETGVSVSLEPPDVEGARWRPTRYMERVSRALEGNSDGLTRRTIRDTVTGKNEHILTALDVLIAEGYVAANTDGRYPTHVSRRPFREDEDDQRSSGSPVVPDRSPGPLNGSGSPVPPFKGPGTTDSTPTGNGVVPLADAEQEQLIARLEAA